VARSTKPCLLWHLTHSPHTPVSSFMGTHDRHQPIQQKMVSMMIPQLNPQLSRDCRKPGLHVQQTPEPLARCQKPGMAHSGHHIQSPCRPPKRSCCLAQARAQHKANAQRKGGDEEGHNARPHLAQAISRDARNRRSGHSLPSWQRSVTKTDFPLVRMVKTVEVEP
jgi:hypothetical protein